MFLGFCEAVKTSLWAADPTILLCYSLPEASVIFTELPLSETFSYEGWRWIQVTTKHVNNTLKFTSSTYCWVLL